MMVVEDDIIHLLSHQTSYIKHLLRMLRGLWLSFIYKINVFRNGVSVTKT